MPTGPARTPQRIPPARTGNPPAAASRSPAPPPGAWSPGLATDAFALQAHVDHLAAQFDLMKAQLRQTQKLASIGTTAAMMAHEFNNLLTPVVAYARHALDSGEVDLMRTALNKTLERTAILNEMASRIIGLARQRDTAIKAVKLKPVVENAIGCLCRDLSRDNIAVNVQIDPELAVRANEGQLLQVLFNLVINARQAMLGRRGRLTVDAAPGPDGNVVVNVRDTGCGITPEHLPRIFEPFFSTKTSADKPDRAGLGLGLCICQQMIEELGGTINVASEVNVGTTFTVTLPPAESV